MKSKTWSDLEFWKSSKWNDIQNFLSRDSADSHYYPEFGRIFTALLLTPLSKVKVVILGQDPYHDGSATGLAFSCNKPFAEVRPSLKNILQEYHDDLKFPYPNRGNLTAWARRGVLLWNCYPTVAPSKPLSHRNIGWDGLTSEILKSIKEVNKDAVYVLWGNDAVSSANSIQGIRRVISSHPSPLAAGRGPIPFLGSRPFTKVNALLTNAGKEPINWSLPFKLEA